MYQQKVILFFYFITLIFISACKKTESCTEAEIQPQPCTQFGIKINSIVYPSYNIPIEFQKTGLKVCITYSTYDDIRACPGPCCGGTCVILKSIKRKN